VTEPRRQTTAADVAVVFDVQKFAVHDGPGIRTLVFFKGCPLRCLWCSNPESQAADKQMIHFESRCLGCLACVARCPQTAIAPDGEGRPQTDRERCDDCGECRDVCYADARLTMGRTVTLPELMAEIRQDAAFYRRSGGGVTLGGGEVMLWAEFAEKLLALCKAESIGTAVETCGHGPWSELERLVPGTDTFYFDLKLIDPVVHERLTGASNATILANLQRLAATAARIVVRIPVVPGLTDSDDNLRGIARYVREHQLGERIELLPYHRLGLDKYRRLGKDYELADLEPPSEERLRRLATLVESEGVACTVGG
jgi:pyruvate formate lyase activating enzyme